jgi:outer membrane biosynthesis protein TonB
VPVELTELVDLDPSRVDLVKSPANGFPILLMKALDAPAGTEDKPELPADNASKESAVPETPQDPQTPEAPEPQAPQAPVEKSAAELVQEEVAKAVSPLNEVIKDLRDEMAALKSTPIPGGPVVTVPTSQRSESVRSEALAKVAYHERLAKSVNDRDLVRYHEDKAKEFRAAANG